MLGQVDYLSLHCPPTAENENFLNARTMAMMKPPAYLISAARGGLVDSEDLVTALKTWVIAGAAMEVLNTEPPKDDEILINAKLDNLIPTPHNAWGAIESRQRLVAQMAENIESYLKGSPVRVVN